MIWYFLSAFALCLLLMRLALDKTRKSAQKAGEKSGYERGYKEGFTAAREIVESIEEWWCVTEKDVVRMQEKIRSEERWP